MATEREREALRLVRPSNRQINVIRCSSNETKEHALAKTVLCKYFQSVKKDFITEAIFATGGRPDIFLLDDLTCIEILHTETLDELKRKVEHYPKGLKIIAIEVA